MNRFLSRIEFSKELGISLSTLHRGIRNDEWPYNAFIRIGNKPRYPISLLDAIEKKAMSKKAEAGDEDSHENKF
jgi:hypothetical protein